MSPAIELWAAVIEQAIRDATSTRIHSQTKGESERTRSACRRWLLAPNSDFAAACELANLCERATREQARARIAAFDDAIAAGARFRQPKAPYRRNEFSHEAR